MVCGLLFWKKGVFFGQAKNHQKIGAQARGRGVENWLDTENGAQLKPLGVMVNHFGVLKTDFGDFWNFSKKFLQVPLYARAGEARADFTQTKVKMKIGKFSNLYIKNKVKNENQKRNFEWDHL